MGKAVRKAKVQVQELCVLFTRNAPKQRLQNRFVWFKKWILERQTYAALSRDSNLSRPTLQRLFYAFLERSPQVKIIKRNRVHLRMDATYFKQFCMVCYQDDEDGYTQLIRVTDGEHFFDVFLLISKHKFNSFIFKA